MYTHSNCKLYLFINLKFPLEYSKLIHYIKQYCTDNIDTIAENIICKKYYILDYTIHVNVYSITYIHMKVHVNILMYSLMFTNEHVHNVTLFALSCIGSRRQSATIVILLSVVFRISLELRCVCDHDTFCGPAGALG